MWLIVLEAAIALTLLLTIVWATWPKKRRDPEQEVDKEEDKDE